MKRANLAVALFVAFLCFSFSTASADIMTYNGIGLNQIVRTHAPGLLADGLSVYAGQDLFTYKGVQYAAYCVDLNQFIGTTEVTEQSVLTLHNGILAADLFNTHASHVATGLDAAALGVAIWEVITEPGGGPFDVTGGNFWITNNPAVATAANALLGTLSSSFDMTFLPTVLHSEQYQDMLIAGSPSQVPEPGTLVLLVMGGAAILVRRRRRAH